MRKQGFLVAVKFYKNIFSKARQKFAEFVLLVEEEKKSALESKKILLF